MGCHEHHGARRWRRDQQALLFEPDESLTGLWSSFDKVPRFLFRVYSPFSQGTTNTTFVASQAWTQYLDLGDLFKLDRNEAADMVADHLNWAAAEYPTNLASWTSSLLFALQLGLHRHACDHERPRLSELYLLAIDTSGFPRGTFMGDLETIEEFGPESADLRQLGRLRTKQGYHFGEYFTQGRLDVAGRCAEASLQRLVDIGLFSLCPGLGDRFCWPLLGERVKRLRAVNWAVAAGTTAPPAETEPLEVVRAVMIGRSFGIGWAVAIAAMFLSLRRRLPCDVSMIVALTNGVCDGCLKDLVENTQVDARSSLVEVQQFASIVEDLKSVADERTKGSPMEALEDSIRDLRFRM